MRVLRYLEKLQVIFLLFFFVPVAGRRFTEHRDARRRHDVIA